MTTRDTAWPAGTPCWADLMTTDQDAAQDFYRGLFGWQIDVGGPDTNNYAMCSVGGHAVAGVMAMAGTDHPPVWTTYLATDDADTTVQAIEAAGGSILQPAIDVMDIGRMAIAQAPGGGVFGLWQSATHTGFGVANETAAVTWTEFMCRDYAGAKEFYEKVFGYTYTELGDGGFQYATAELDGTTVGGIGVLPDEVPAHVPPHWRVYFAVDDADAAVATVEELAGTVLRPPTDMPYGRHADVTDPQGAMFAVITPARTSE